jgi:hypothetical protein
MSCWRSRSAGTKNRDDVQPEIQVFAEASGTNLRRQILVGRRHHAHVDLDPLRAADTLHHLFLQHAQHLGLRLQAHVGDLVEEDRALVGLLEAPGLVGNRAGERPSDVPNNSDSMSSSGTAAQFTFDEGVVLAPAGEMNGARDQFLAGAALAENQHAAVGRRRQRHMLAQFGHRRALAHHRVLLLAIDLGAQDAVLRSRSRCRSALRTTSTVFSSDSGFSMKS